MTRTSRSRSAAIPAVWASRGSVAMISRISSDRPRWATSAERRRRVVVDPQAGLVDAEQGEGFVDDVAEEPVEVLAAADLGGDPAQGVGAGRAVGDGVAARILAGRCAGDDHRWGRPPRTGYCQPTSDGEGRSNHGTGRARARR